MKEVPITLEAYLMGRDKLYAEEFHDLKIKENATRLLEQVNGLLIALGLDPVKVRSGWRPRDINTRVGGSVASYHIVGRAVDISDVNGDIKQTIIDNHVELNVWGLWMESPGSTPSWCHLDNGLRENRSPRIFLP